MLSLDEINDEITTIEAKGETTYAVIQRLAPLYIVRDKLTETTSIINTADNDNILQIGDTPFLRVASKCDVSTIMSIMDELMSTIQLTAPALYGAVMQKISSV